MTKPLREEEVIRQQINSIFLGVATQLQVGVFNLIKELMAQQLNSQYEKNEKLQLASGAKLTSPDPLADDDLKQAPTKRKP
jgi:hypothetical protein